jgi:hypothetical protein
MYRVKFARKLADDMVDLGDVLICAASQELACDSVSHMLGIKLSVTEMEVSRVKPSFYQISRRNVKHSISTSLATAIDVENASSATFPNQTESMPEEHWFAVMAMANIRADNENRAISKLSVAIAREMTGEKQKMSTRELEIRCDRTEWHPRQAAIERQALYAEPRIFQGGDARSR